MSPNNRLQATAAGWEVMVRRVGRAPTAPEPERYTAEVSLPNPMTEGQFGDETPSLVERLLAAICAIVIIALNFRFDLSARATSSVVGLAMLVGSWEFVSMENGFPDQRIARMTDSAGADGGNVGSSTVGV